MDWSRAVALVTGASSGIGYETALAFAARGARVVGVARREDRLRELIAECNRQAPRASFLAGDLGDPDFAQRAVGETVSRHGRIDVLVNNAGMPKHKQIYDLSPSEAEQVLRVNFLSAVWTTLAAIQPMLAQGGGVIVNVSSFAALVVPPRESIYAASKAALNAWSAGLWNDLAGSGVHVALVNPGAIATEIWEKLDQPPAFAGRKHPPQIVVDAILECVEKRRHECTVPRHSVSLFGARLLRALTPGLLRRAMTRFDPVPAEVLAQAQASAGAAERSRRD